MIKHKLTSIFIVSLFGCMASLGCETDSATDTDGLTGTDNNGTDTGIENNGTDTGQQQACAINALENFDNGLPAGWTIIAGAGGGSGSNSGSGTGTGTGAMYDPTDANNPNTWHHTTIEAEQFLAEEAKSNMSAGLFKVGDVMGINEELLTGFYDINTCQSVSVTFKHYFEDFSSNPHDRGELWVAVDGPPWQLVQTFNTTGYFQEVVDISSFLTGGMSFQVKFVFTDMDPNDPTGARGNWPWFVDDVSISGAK